MSVSVSVSIDHEFGPLSFYISLKIIKFIKTIMISTTVII